MDSSSDRDPPAEGAPPESDPAARGKSRRSFLKTGAAGVVAAAVGPKVLAAGDKVERVPRVDVHDPKRKVLRGGVVLSLDPKVGDFAKADVVIEGKKIAAVGPNVGRVAGQEIDCRGTVVVPGFISTHNHQYEILQRSIIADGLIVFPGDPEQQPSTWPHEAYSTVVQGIWTSGRLPDPETPGSYIWDLGRSPYDPEDCYIAELVACLGQITQGITMSTDTSQSSHTPEYTDAMIEGIMDSGMRVLFDYSSGTNRSAQFPDQPFEYPGAIGETSYGIGRLATTYFNSKDQLVTLGLGAGPGPVTDPKTGETRDYTGWQLAREFGAHINNHNVGGIQTVLDAAADPRNGDDWSDVTLVHCVRWQDEPVAQIGVDNVTSRAWEVFSERGGHASIAPLIEQQMRHGMPPFQLCLNHGILPSLSPDVETNMTPDPFSMMRSAFTLQRALANDLAFPISDPNGLVAPQLVTSRQVLEMMTIAGAAGSGVLDKVGTLTPGKEADIVVLDSRNLNISPMNNAPGSVVTMMNQAHVRHVLIAGRFKVRSGKLVGWDVERLVRKVERARERVLERINGPSLTGPLPKGLNSEANPYRPNFLGSCCYVGQNTVAPEYTLRP
ncbi:MAG TPA: amidohydrolase family protein [Gemmatimonadales bacterium]|nr:amidohydrolase family protein [Gemmatimonadales bacterium]